MTEFPEVEKALRQWVMEVVPILVAEPHVKNDIWMVIPQWDCDSDGIFRDTTRPADVWDYHYLEQFQSLPSWANVVKVFQQDGRLSRQVDTLVGTIQGGMRVEVFSLAKHTLPRPGELDRATEVFEGNYAQVEKFLAAEDLEFKTLWPVQGLTAGDMPLQMEPGVELDAMTDQELAFALRTDIVRPHFPNEKIFQASAGDRTCFRYRYVLPKLVGVGHDQERVLLGRELEKRRAEIQSTIEEALALILPEPMMINGRLVISDSQWNPTADGGVQYLQATVPRSMRVRHFEMNDQLASDLKELWLHLSRRDLVQRQKGLSLAMRRLSYQAQRERPEDELLDAMIAAEALYLTDLGNETYRGELRYRLALQGLVKVAVTVCD